ncbi:MAG: radical SAM protein [Bacteroidetes bacterium]|nr:radical SAM protein [Bacteroidota bacterium]
MLWHINDLCNFGCVYCFFPKVEKEHPEVGRFTPQQIYEAFQKTGRNWHLFISGGEPLLYPDFIELVNLLKTNHPIQISTNLYNKNVKEFAERVSPENIIVINASLHILHHNSKSLQKFISNYHLFLNKGFDIIVSYVTYPPLFKRIKDDFLFLKNEGVQYVLPCTYNGTFEGKKYPGSYTREQMRIIREIYQEPLELLVVMDKMHFYNKLCRAGKDYFFMDLKGEVFRCCTIWDSYGNLYQGTFKPDTSAKPCTSHICHDHCHGMMSLIEEPQPPEEEFYENGFFREMTIKSLDIVSRMKKSLQSV